MAVYVLGFIFAFAPSGSSVQNLRTLSRVSCSRTNLLTFKPSLVILLCPSNLLHLAYCLFALLNSGLPFHRDILLSYCVNIERTIY